MKKLVLMAAAIVAVSFASCGNKAANAEQAAADLTKQLTLNKQQLILSVSLIQSQLLKQPQQKLKQQPLTLLLKIAQQL